MATIAEVEAAVQHVYGTVEQVASQAPCGQSATCILIVQGAASRINLALLPYVASQPDGTSCAEAVEALDALAATISRSPPLDHYSIVAVDRGIEAALAAMRPPLRR